MQILRTLVLTVLLSMSMATLAADNSRLQQLKNEDQADRQGAITQAQWPEVSKRDAERRATLMTLLRVGEVRTATDYYNAALIMQHGDTIDDIRMAHALATISATINPSDRSAKWLTAASWDRILMRMKRPQWYGTQFVTGDDGKWMLYEVDESAVTDEDRQALSVPTLAEAQKRTEAMNGAR